METKVLTVENVSKTQNDKVILRQISFQVKSGEIFGIVGPENSGKSTLINTICGAILPTTGHIEICGKNIVDEFESAIEYVGGALENSNVYTNMSGIQNLRYYAGFYDNIGKKNERIESLAKFLEIEDCLHDLVKHYSDDKKQKIVIAQALLHFPSVLILDEPTKNLEEQNIEGMRNFLKKVIKKYNIAVVVASKNLSEMQILCDKIAVMDKGEILDVMTSEDIKNGIKAGQKVAFKVNYPNFGAKILREKFKLNPYAVGTEILLKIPEKDIQKVSGYLTKYNVAIFGTRVIEKTFEDIYTSIIRKNAKKSQLIGE